MGFTMSIDVKKFQSIINENPSVSGTSFDFFPQFAKNENPKSAQTPKDAYVGKSKSSSLNDILSGGRSIATSADIAPPPFSKLFRNS